ncbi:putative membrane protein [Halobacteroides halobius DSM 5150]|uniref:Putative membrane protein n=1 Tax=Halobacteroides halobius (strain ATCC 35273 / DSM 5150 / MD-1) TaxID=748449 RepID=L0K6U0_HALHC|nr:DUF421 domain-containing protein [Halobacteroides halobius]AGB40741.1 putative membrane protein [Halobacteroides halobius DSM 5150]
MNETLVILFRSVIGFITLLIFTRVLGKQQIGQLTYFDYIIGITIGSIAASLTTDLITGTWPQWIGLAAWTAGSLLMQFITLKSRPASKYIDGESTIVIMNGKIMEENLARLRYRVTDLLEMLRNKGIFNPSEVEFAIMETNGKLSVLKKSQYQTVTAKDMNLSTDYKGLSVEIIYDGALIEQNLKQVNLDQKWLQSQLNNLGISDIKKVFLATLDTSGKLYIDTYQDDNLEVPINISDYPGAN